MGVGFCGYGYGFLWVGELQKPMYGSPPGMALKYIYITRLYLTTPKKTQEWYW